ncbi:MAG: acetyl-CoA hydrolase/transferase C-terminal domain-containing protein [Burkholderiaceae bacterium]
MPKRWRFPAIAALAHRPRCARTAAQTVSYPVKMVVIFALGSDRLYTFMHRNPMLAMHPVSFANDPYIAEQNDKRIAINASLQADLPSQCGSESIGHVLIPPNLFMSASVVSKSLRPTT